MTTYAVTLATDEDTIIEEEYYSSIEMARKAAVTFAMMMQEGCKLVIREIDLDEDDFEDDG